MRVAIKQQQITLENSVLQINEFRDNERMQTKHMYGKPSLMSMRRKAANDRDRQRE